MKLVFITELHGNGLHTSADYEQEGGGCFDNPPHVVCISGQANDTELPGLRFDTDKAELSFEWEGMLQNFLAERAEFARRTAASQARLSKAIGRANVTEVLKAVKDHDKLMVKVRKELRRERILKYYRAIDDFWEGEEFPFEDEEEAECLQRIQYKAGKGSEWPELQEEELDYTNMISLDDVVAAGESESDSDSDDVSESNDSPDDDVDDI